MTKRTILFPGQGAQFKGMGRSLFAAYPDLVRRASTILGYDIERLCLEDPGKQLSLTQFTQPALFVVNALGYINLRDKEGAGFRVDFLAGHSLGEYNALLAAEVFDFETGLRLVKLRGELMALVGEGAMAAIIGVPVDVLQTVLREAGLSEVDLANFNTPSQLVIAGTKSDIATAVKACNGRGIRCVPLNVSAAFHSRHMLPLRAKFASALRQFRFAPPRREVIANITALPYDPNRIADTLADQLAETVRWSDTIQYLLRQGDMDFLEVGSTILTKMVNDIRAAPPSIQAKPVPLPPESNSPSIDLQKGNSVCERMDTANGPQSSQLAADSLGSLLFRQRYITRFAYAAGSMYQGIASPQFVARMAKAGLMAFFGTGGLSTAEIDDGLRYLEAHVGEGQVYGANLLADYRNSDREERTVDLLLKAGVRYVEAAAYVQPTLSLVLYRAKGLRRAEDGSVRSTNRILAKVSRPEVASIFLSPPPQSLVETLVGAGRITSDEARMVTALPLAHEVCVEADSGGHTDGANPTVVLPAILRLRDAFMAKYKYADPILIGLAGGIGTPESAAAGFLMGADFIVTGSINQCTVEAGTSAEVKSILQEVDIQDTAYAPAGDLFEAGAKVQVLRRGVFFPARANKLFSLYNHYDSLDEIPAGTRKQIEDSYFGRTFEEVWQDTKDHLAKSGRTHDIARAEINPKLKMAAVFRWYFARTSRLALEGDPRQRVNYQVHVGPALGAFNQWIKGSEIELWTDRHPDIIAERLMTATAAYLEQRCSQLLSPLNKCLPVTM